MKRWAAGILLVVLVAAAPLASANCKVCDGNGCKNAAATETGRNKCDSTPSSCTLSGTTCFSGGGCDCGELACGFCENSCLQTPFENVQWQLVSAEVTLAAAEARPDWILVRVDVASQAR